MLSDLAKTSIAHVSLEKKNILLHRMFPFSSSFSIFVVLYLSEINILL